MIISIHLLIFSSVSAIIQFKNTKESRCNLISLDQDHSVKMQRLKLALIAQLNKHYLCFSCQSLKCLVFGQAVFQASPPCAREYRLLRRLRHTILVDLK